MLNSEDKKKSIEETEAACRHKKKSDRAGGDTTDRKIVQEALRESENRYRTVVENAGEGIVVVQDKMLQFVNSRFTDVMGYSQEELTTRPFIEFVHPNDRERVMEIHIKRFKGEEFPRVYELRVIDQQGTTKWLESNGILIAWGGKSASLNFLRDITDRKQAEERLQQESLMRKTILDNLPCAAMILRKGTREIVASNEVARSAGAVPGKTCYETYIERNDKCPFCLAPEVWETNEPRRLEFEYRGTYYEGMWVPLTEDLYAHYVFDISDCKRAEQKILEDRAQLKSLASQLSRTEERERHRLATALHDQIGQSLVFSKLKLDQLRISETSGELAAALEEVCDRLGQVIQETRTLTFDLSSPILYELGFETAVAEWLADEIKEKHGIETQFEDDGLQKPLDDDIRAILFRNVRELLTNVIKYAQAQRVKVSISRVDQTIHVSVEDDGVGFDAVEVISMAAKSDKFGLFSIRERLEQLGGLIEIDSAPGRGSRISMTAPLKCEILTDETEL